MKHPMGKIQVNSLCLTSSHTHVYLPSQPCHLLPHEAPLGRGEVCVCVCVRVCVCVFVHVHNQRQPQSPAITDI